METVHDTPVGPRREWWAGFIHWAWVLGLGLRTFVVIWPYMIARPRTYHHRLKARTIACFALPSHQIVWAMKSLLYAPGQSRREDRIWALTPEYIVALKCGAAHTSSRFIPRESIIGLKSRMMRKHGLLDLTLYARHVKLRLTGVAPENLAALQANLQMRRRKGNLGLEDEAERREKEAHIIAEQPAVLHVVQPVERPAEEKDNWWVG